MFKKILIANRGEIAGRILRTAHKLGIKTVGIYAPADKQSLPMQWMNETYALEGNTLEETYLNIPKIIDIAKQSGVEAIHPGYGFLSENPAFAEACEAAGICFIGPSAQVIALMGSKQAARAALEKSEIPIIPGYQGEQQDKESLFEAAKKIGFPVLIKPSAGGGGKAMRVVKQRQDFLQALAQCQREALAYFNDDTIVIEKYLSPTRHIEVQIAADTQGNVVHLFERDCSIQRRHQKIIEEAPCDSIDDALRHQLGEMAILVARRVGYTNVGTVEFLVDSGGNPYFMEMNTRLQVEHAITEQITSIDLVSWQLWIAAKLPLPAVQSQIKRHGHAIEVRVYAEDPDNDFLPSTGTVQQVLMPETSDMVRIESSMREGEKVDIFYDPLLAKLIVWGENRRQAILKMQQALEHVHVLGIKTNLNFLRNVVYSPVFAESMIDADFLDKQLPRHRVAPKPPHPFVWSLAAVAALLNSIKHQQNGHYYHGEPGSPWQNTDHWRLNYTATHEIRLKEMSTGKNGTFHIQHPEHEFVVTREMGEKSPEETSNFSAGFITPYIMQVVRDGRSQFFYSLEHAPWLYFFANHTSYLFEVVDPYSLDKPVKALPFDALQSPMPGIVRQIFVKEGDKVQEGAPLMALEAMKMEHTITAPYAGKVTKIFYKVGDVIEGQVEVLEIKHDRE